MPATAAPTLTADPLTADTVSVSPLSTSVSLVSTLPAAEGSPGNGVLPGLTPDSTTGSPPLVSATATGASLVPVTVMVIVEESVAPCSSLIE